MTLKTKEQEFLSRIEQHKGILYKVSKMYMDNRDDQEDLFQEFGITYFEDTKEEEEEKIRLREEYNK